MRLSELTLLGDDVAGSLYQRRLDEAAVDPASNMLEIFVWTDAPSATRAGRLLEAIGNKTVRLTGRYSFRYDPPRTASTGAGQTFRADFHLYDGGVEIAAWDDMGKGRHGFPAGTRLPRKAYDALIAKYPDAHGLRGRVLEQLTQAAINGQTTVELPMRLLQEG